MNEKQAELTVKSYILPGNKVIKTRFVIATAVFIPVCVLIIARTIYAASAAGNVPDGSLFPDMAVYLVFAVVIWLLFAMPYFSLYGNAAKCLRLLRRNGLIGQAAEELQACRYDESGQDKRAGVLSEHFLFARNIGSVLSYDDIAYAYPLVYRFIDGRQSGILCARSRTRRSVLLFYLGSDDIEQRAGQFLAAIRAKAPSVTMGKTKRRFTLHTYKYARERKDIVKIRNS